jgi:hypothetical protein
MKTKYITERNRKEVQRKYIDQILGEMDFMQIKDKLRDFLTKEKDKSGNYSLESEIRKEAPEVLVDNWQDFDQPSTLTKSKSKSKSKDSNIDPDDHLTQEELYNAQNFY